jgi:hypothetical protein
MIGTALVACTALHGHVGSVLVYVLKRKAFLSFLRQVLRQAFQGGEDLPQGVHIECTVSCWCVSKQQLLPLMGAHCHS